LRYGYLAFVSNLLGINNKIGSITNDS